jgi:hypothetical protein
VTPTGGGPTGTRIETSTLQGNGPLVLADQAKVLASTLPGELLFVAGVQTTSTIGTSVTNASTMCRCRHPTHATRLRLRLLSTALSHHSCLRHLGGVDDYSGNGGA